MTDFLQLFWIFFTSTVFEYLCIEIFVPFVVLGMVLTVLGVIIHGKPIRLFR